MGENVENLLLERLRGLREARIVLAGALQILAAQDADVLRVETRLGQSRSART